MTVCRVTVVGVIAGQTTNNVMHFRSVDTTPDMIAALGPLVRDWFVDNPMRLNCDGHMSWSKVHVNPLESSVLPYDISFSMVGVGGPSTNFLPFVTAVFQLQTGVAGRRGRGRIYAPGFGQGQFNNGLWDDSAMVRLNAVAAALQAFWVDVSGPNYKGQGWDMVVCPRGDPSSPLGLSAVVARTMVGSQRRRQLGVGI